MKKMTNDDYKNLFPFIEKVLKFYAEPNNYKRNSGNAIIFPAIEMDCGTLAKSALERIKGINDLYDKSLNDIKDVNKDIEYKLNDIDILFENLKIFDND